MIEFGKTLRAAREAKGYTVSQLSEATRMAPTTVSELENEDFSHIAAPIYGRGFVKLYCEAVGLESKPLVDEFMAIYNGDRDVNIRERPTAAAVTTPSVSETPAPASEAPLPPKPEPQQDLFAQEPPPPAKAPMPTAFAEAEDDALSSRYATPLRQGREPRLPQVPWRICLLGAVSLVLLILIGFGIRALYRATSNRATSNATTPAATAPAPAQATAKRPTAKDPAPAREPQRLPPFYID